MAAKWQSDFDVQYAACMHIDNTATRSIYATGGAFQIHHSELRTTLVSHNFGVLAKIQFLPSFYSLQIVSPNFCWFLNQLESWVHLPNAHFK